MPAGIVAGDRLVVCAAFDTSAAVTVPGDWTTTSNTTNGAAIRLLVLTKVAAGSDTLTLTTVSSTVSSAHASFRTFSNDNTIRSGTAATGTSDSPDPPSLNNGTSEKFLWFAVTGWGSSATATAYPTSFSDNQLTAAVGNVGVAVATRDNEASTQDPAVFTISGSALWVSQTLSIDEQALVVGNFPIVTQPSTIFSLATDFAGNGNFALLEMNSTVFQPTATVGTKTTWVNEAATTETNWVNET